MLVRDLAPLIYYDTITCMVKGRYRRVQKNNLKDLENMEVEYIKGSNNGKIILILKD